MQLTDLRPLLRREDPAELFFSENILQRVTSVHNSLTLCDHDLLYLSA